MTTKSMSLGDDLKAVKKINSNFSTISYNDH